MASKEIFGVRVELPEWLPFPDLSAWKGPAKVKPAGSEVVASGFRLSGDRKKVLWVTIVKPAGVLISADEEEGAGIFVDRWMAGQE